MDVDEDGMSPYSATRATLDALRVRGEKAEPPDAMDGEWVRARTSVTDGGMCDGDDTSIASYMEVEKMVGSGTPSALQYSKVGARNLATGDISGGIMVTRCASGDMEAASAYVKNAHLGRVTRVDWNLNGSLLISGSVTGQVKIWNVNHTSKSTISIALHSEVDVVSEVTTVMFHPVHIDLALVGLKSRQVIIIDASLGMVIERLTMKNVPLSFDLNTSGTIIFIGDDEGRINIANCEPRMKKTLSLKPEREAAVENPLQRVIAERSASQTERMDAVGTLRGSDTSIMSNDDMSSTSTLRSKFKSLLATAKNAVPRPQIGEIKMGYKLRALGAVGGPKEPCKLTCMRYCTYPDSVGGAALLAFYENGEIRIFRAEGTPFKELRLFTTCRIASSPQDGDGVIAFAPGQLLALPLVSASRGNRTAIYLLPATPGAPVQATQFTDDFDFETNSEKAIDVAVVSVWSHEGSHLAIGYSSGKISIWQRQ
jgi:WD40 repeat protein